MVIPVQFVSDLADELREILKHLKFPSHQGEGRINVFEYGLPIQESDDEEEPFPYLIVRPIEGETEDSELPQKVEIGILIGIYNTNLEERGERYVLNVINDIQERFMKNPVLRGFYADDKIKWVIQTEDTYPYFFGGIEMTFNIPTFRRENRFA